MTEGLTSGDKVIVLADAAARSGLIAGAVAGGIAGWIAKHSIGLSMMAFFIGGFIGWLLGTVAGHIMFPERNGNVMVVKVGPSALPGLLKADIISSLVTAIVICGLMVLITKVDLGKIAGPCIGTAVVLGIIRAFWQH